MDLYLNVLKHDNEKITGNKKAFSFGIFLFFYFFFIWQAEVILSVDLNMAFLSA